MLCNRTGKRQYESRAEAGEVHAKVRAFRSRRKLEIYKCRYCKRFHLGHSRLNFFQKPWLWDQEPTFEV